MSNVLECTVCPHFPARNAFRNLQLQRSYITANVAIVFIICKLYIMLYIHIFTYNVNSNKYFNKLLVVNSFCYYSMKNIHIFLEKDFI